MKRPKGRVKRRFAVRRSGIHGKGVFALVGIPKKSRIIEYTGDRMSHDEADDRYGEEQENSPHTMLFTVDENIVIDATRHGSSARWINHSCAPNCEAVDEEGRIYIDTIRSILPGEELTYDYNLILEEPHTPAAKRLHACFCGARKCRGTILARKR